MPTGFLGHLTSMNDDEFESTFVASICSAQSGSWPATPGVEAPVSGEQNCSDGRSGAWANVATGVAIAGVADG